MMKRSKVKKLTPLPKLQKKAQEVFNKHIRKRDQDKGCISCGAEVEQAGHYFSQGHHSALRFNETNTNGQCIRCNCFLHGNLINYRKGLIQRYGVEVVEQLELNADLHKVKKFSRLELEWICITYAEIK
jgi:hypothetical protein